jgi:hypothetical protein
MTFATRIRLLAGGLLLAAVLGGAFAAPAAATHYDPAGVHFGAAGVHI